MVTSNSPTFCVPPFPIGFVSFSNPLLPIHRHVSKIATICGLCCFASSSRSPRWSECACERKITSSLGTFFSLSGHIGLVITQGSINATCPEAVVSENVLCPKYVMRLPFMSSMLHLGRECTGTLAGFGCGCGAGSRVEVSGKRSCYQRAVGELRLRRSLECLRRGHGRLGCRPYHRERMPGARHSTAATLLE